MRSLVIETYIKSLGKQIINESQESTSQHEAMKLFMQRTGKNKDEAEQFVRVSLRNDLPTLRDKKAGKFTLGVTRMFLNRELNNADIITKLNKTLKYVASDIHINEYDRNLNGETAQTLIDRFATAVKSDLDADKEELGKQSYNNRTEYDIVKIESFEEAEEYGDYVSWCVTHDEGMFDSYTSGGVNVFYFCLRDGFEDEKKTRGENCPLDSYGLSMIAVSVAPDGSLNTCTCRWNHSNGGNDSIMNTKQISQTIGMNFYNVFKGNEEYLGLVNTCKKLGVNIQDLDFNNNGYSSISRCIGDQWEYNVINKEGELLFNDKWIDGGYHYIDGSDGKDTIEVTIDDKCNLVGEKFCLLSPELWFDNISRDSDDYTLYRVELNGKYNILTYEGKLLSPDLWVDKIHEGSKCGLRIVELNGKFNFIGNNGILSPDLWFDYIKPFIRSTYSKVYANKKWNLIDFDGRMVSPKLWFDKIVDYTYSFVMVKNEGKFNLIRYNGKILSPNRWFDNIDLKDRKFRSAFHVKISNEWYYIDYDGLFYNEDGYAVSLTA